MAQDQLARPISRIGHPWPGPLRFRLLQPLEPLLERKQGLLRWIGGDSDHQPVDEVRAALEETGLNIRSMASQRVFANGYATRTLAARRKNPTH